MTMPIRVPRKREGSRAKSTARRPWRGTARQTAACARPRCIGSDLAAVLIRRARKLYANEARCRVGQHCGRAGLQQQRAVFERVRLAPFHSTKAAFKLHTLQDLSRSIPAFIHVSASCTMSMCWTSCRWRLDPSTSWIALTWTSSVQTVKGCVLSCSW